MIHSHSRQKNDSLAFGMTAQKLAVLARVQS